MSGCEILMLGLRNLFLLITAFHMAEATGLKIWNHIPLSASGPVVAVRQNTGQFEVLYILHY